MVAGGFVATDVSAARGGAPDPAVGDLFGSSMAILTVIDLVHRGRVWPGVGPGHARLAAIAIGLTSAAVLVSYVVLLAASWRFAA